MKRLSTVVWRRFRCRRRRHDGRFFLGVWRAATAKITESKGSTRHLTPSNDDQQKTEKPSKRTKGYCDVVMLVFFLS